MPETPHQQRSIRDRKHDVIRDMDPPKGDAYELRLAAAVGNGNGSSAGLFAKSFALTGAELAAQLASFNLTKRNLRDLEKLADEDPFAIAVQLDKAVNGTSLLLMFELGNAHLLFPGDAQWGTWQNALADPEFHALLEKTNFLKVGHHGSHNATPRDFVETILEKGGFSAMVCTHETKKFKKIPLPSLLKALGQRSNNRLARSDETGGVSKGSRGRAMSIRTRQSSCRRMNSDSGLATVGTPEACQKVAPGRRRPTRGSQFA